MANKTTKKPNKKVTKNKKKQEYTEQELYNERFIVLGIFIAPLIAWLIGLAVNPDGWLSNVFGLFIAVISALAAFWFISLPTLAALVVFALKKEFKLMRRVALVLSIVTSILVYMFVSSAEEDEFA